MEHRDEDLLPGEEEVEEDLGAGGEADAGAEPLLLRRLVHRDTVDEAAVALSEKVRATLFTGARTL